MIRRTRLLATALVCSVALLVGACGGDGDSTSSTSTGTTGATGEPVAGGHARILTMAEPRSLDPATLGNAYATTAVVGNALYGTLMIDDDSGGLEFKMAESFTTNDGGQTFELKLRPGLVFSDGTPLNAEAVKFNWDRTKDPAVGSTYASEASMIASTEVVDDVTLKVTMAQPMPKFGQVIATSTLNWIASPAALQAGQEAFNANPIGAGPFTLESWNRQADMVLVKNPKYWDAPKPYLDRITLRTATDAGQRYNTVLTGGADVAVETNWQNIAKAEEAGLPNTVMDLSGGLFMALNSRRAPFDDVRARQAVAAALDLEALNLAVYNGTGRTAEHLFAESSPFRSDTPLTTTDKDKAQRLFDELAAEGKPVSFTFTTFPTTENKAMAENVQAQLSAFNNVNVEVKVVDLAEVGKLRATHDFDVLISSAFFRDPEPRLWTAFSSEASANMSGVKDPALDQALLDGRNATTVEERKTAYETAQQRLREQVPVVFLVRVAAGVVTAKNVGGVMQYGHGSLMPEELWIQK